jgi:tyrosyl-tRNA synthetase
MARAEQASSLLFGERIAELAVEDVLAVFEDVPSTEVPTGDVDPHGIGLVDLLARVQLAPSKSEARRLVQSGGVYVNQPACVRSAGAADTRAGDRRAALRVAEGTEAESPGAAHVAFNFPLSALELSQPRHVQVTLGGVA